MNLLFANLSFSFQKGMWQRVMAARLKPPDNVTLTQRNQRKAGMNTASVGLMLVKFLGLSPPCSKHGKSHQRSMAVEFITTLYHRSWRNVVDSSASSRRNGNPHRTDIWHLRRLLTIRTGILVPEMHQKPYQMVSWIGSRNALKLCPRSSISNHRSRKAWATFLDILSWIGSWILQKKKHWS